MDEQERNSEEPEANAEGAGGRRTVDLDRFGCCRSMAERMINGFGAGPGRRAGEQGGAVDPDLDDRRTTMMARMMSACCRPRERDAKRPDEKAGECCGES